MRQDVSLQVAQHLLDVLASRLKPSQLQLHIRPPYSDQIEEAV
jgi:hypothetical protein